MPVSQAVRLNRRRAKLTLNSYTDFGTSMTSSPPPSRENVNGAGQLVSWGTALKSVPLVTIAPAAGRWAALVGHEGRENVIVD